MMMMMMMMKMIMIQHGEVKRRRKKTHPKQDAIAKVKEVNGTLLVCSENSSFLLFQIHPPSLCSSNDPFSTGIPSKVSFVITLKT